jgi:hypothetical protein
MLDPRAGESVVVIENLGIPQATAKAALTEDSALADLLGAELPDDAGRVSVLVHSGAVHVNYDAAATAANADIGGGFDFFGPKSELDKVRLINAGATAVSVFVYRVLAKNI